ncbi:MAG: MmcQ/YjbR family DNA-binding protein [Oleibacter sp.]|nr:MmcQ/YjbR family DNA-binding protein [Thalassolituus sp.]
MTRDELHDYLGNKFKAVKDFPFGPKPCVYKVSGKVFAIVFEEKDSWRLNLKSPPEEAIQLRDVFTSVTAGYHMNKRHWNTLLFPGDVPTSEVERQIDVSYELVVNGLSKSMKRLLGIDLNTQ